MNSENANKCTTHVDRENNSNEICGKDKVINANDNVGMIVRRGK